VGPVASFLAGTVGGLAHRLARPPQKPESKLLNTIFLIFCEICLNHSSIRTPPSQVLESSRSLKASYRQVVGKTDIPVRIHLCKWKKAFPFIQEQRALLHTLS
jgi:hypothetical protein